MALGKRQPSGKSPLNTVQQAKKYLWSRPIPFALPPSNNSKPGANKSGLMSSNSVPAPTHPPSCMTASKQLGSAELKIGRASCRERVEIAGGGGECKEN